MKDSNQSQDKYSYTQYSGTSFYHFTNLSLVKLQELHKLLE